MIASILITVYNCQTYVLQAVADALDQRFESFEVLAVDDGSTDDTAKLLCTVKDDRLRVLTVDRLGRAKALNFGLSQARGKYVAILDADDRSLPHRLAEQVRFFDAHPEVVIAGSRFRTYIDCGGNLTGHEDIEPETHAEIIRKFKNGQNALFHSSVMMEKEKIKSIGAYDENLSCMEDWDIYARAARHFELANIDSRLSAKRIHDGQFFDGKNGAHYQLAAQEAKNIILERIRLI